MGLRLKDLTNVNRKKRCKIIRICFEKLREQDYRHWHDLRNLIKSFDPSMLVEEYWWWDNMDKYYDALGMFVWAHAVKPVGAWVNIEHGMKVNSHTYLTNCGKCSEEYDDWLCGDKFKNVVKEEVLCKMKQRHQKR